jgi:hypothetical protein
MMRKEKRKCYKVNSIKPIAKRKFYIKRKKIVWLKFENKMNRNYLNLLI